MAASISSSIGTFAQYHLATGGASQRGCIRRWAGGTEPDGALFSSALRSAVNFACCAVFRGQPACCAFIYGRGTTRTSFWPPQYHGFHPSAIQYPAGADGCNADFPSDSVDLAHTSIPLADGCPDTPGLHHGTGRTRSAHGNSQRYITCSQCWLVHQPHLLRPPPARASSAARITISTGWRAQISI